MPIFFGSDGQGPYVSQTPILDVTDLKGKDLGSPEFREFIIRLTQRLNDISLVLNSKDTGLYLLEEYLCSQQFFPDTAQSSVSAQAPTERGVYRKVINFGVLDQSAGAGPYPYTSSVAHGIDVTTSTTFTRIYGTANDTSAPGFYMPLPFVDVSGASPAGNVELNLDDTNVYITVTTNGTAFDPCYVIVEFIQS